ncbi:MAG: hypothetical protein WEH44_03965 [Pirellulaceae bacterium]
MNSKTDDLLDTVDAWKEKVHDELKGLSKSERKTYWARIGQKASEMGLKAIEPAKTTKRTTRRVRRTG